MWENDYSLYWKCLPLPSGWNSWRHPCQHDRRSLIQVWQKLWLCMPQQRAGGWDLHNYRVRSCAANSVCFKQSAFWLLEKPLFYQLLMSLQTFITRSRETQLKILGIKYLKLLFCIQCKWIAAVWISLYAWGQTARMLTFVLTNVWKCSYIWPNNYVFPIL